MKPKYRVCSKCGDRWNVSSIGSNDKKYICPICEHKAKSLIAARRRIAVEKRREIA